MSVMPPQHQMLKRDPSGEYPVVRYYDLQSADTSMTLSSINTNPPEEEEPCRAAEAWLSRGGAGAVSSESLEQHWSSQGGGLTSSSSFASSGEALSSLSSSGRGTSLRERLHRRILLKGNKEEINAKYLLDAPRLTLRDLRQRHFVTQHFPPPPPPPNTTPNSPLLHKTLNHNSDLLDSYRHLIDQQPGRSDGQNDDTITKRKTEQKAVLPQMTQALQTPPSDLSSSLSNPNNQRKTARQKSPSTEQKAVLPQMTQALQKTPPSDLSSSLSNPNNHQTEEAQQQKTAAAEAYALSLMRLSRQGRYSRRGVANAKKENSIKLHIYNLMPQETIVTFGWGLECPIGQCFSAMNNGLHALGTGAYHCGIEVNGIEYAYGANDSEGTTGVFSCLPMRSPGFEYRTSLDFGSRPLTRTAWVRVETQGKTQSTYREIVTYIEGRDVMKDMAREYLGPDYDLLRKNCCTFARDACLRLGICNEEIPSWFLNLADAGAAGQDVAWMAIQPIASMLSAANDTDGEDDDSIVDTSAAGDMAEVEPGFEVIAKGKEGSHQKTKMEIVRVVDAVEMEHQPGAGSNGCGDGTSDELGARLAVSWTY